MFVEIPSELLKMLAAFLLIAAKLIDMLMLMLAELALIALYTLLIASDLIEVFLKI